MPTDHRLRHDPALHSRSDPFRGGRSAARRTCQLLLAGSLCLGALTGSLRALAAGPDLATLVHRANAARSAGNTALARTLIDPVLRAPSIDAATRAETYLLRARLFLDEGAPVSARLDAERATRYDPTNGNALSLLARLYRTTAGPSAGADATASARLYLKAARQGVVEAQREAGALLLEGIGITADLRKARYWLGRAADAGDVQAMLLLAQSYGDAVAPDSRDEGLAAEWLRRATALGGIAASARGTEALPAGTLGGAAGGMDDEREP